jgi:protein-disulfide isomerase
LHSTRRQFLNLLVPLLAAGSLLLDGMKPSSAQTVPEAALMKAGPLGEEAMGSNSAPVTIIEYASLTCPHCAHFAETTFPKLKKEYIDTGKVRYILREFPLDPLSTAALMLARCAPQDQYFSVIELLFRTQEQWLGRKPMDALLSVATQAGFTRKSFNACLADEKIFGGIEWVRDRGAKRFQVDATPTFFINGRKYTGDMSIEQLAKAIQPDLES